jgi:MinD-like ATPase involved in chromosome partitioning or flagellar assembly
LVTTFVAFHSLKGGTGKSTLATNFAALRALATRNVCLLDFDFRAPSLHVFFEAKPRFWLNDFLNGRCEITDALQEIKIGGAGKLVVGFANPSTESMRDMMTKDREWEANALHKVLSAKNVIMREGYDLVVFDTSPGIQYSSVNALAASSLVVLVMNREELYREDVANLVKNVYKTLGRKVGITLNKVLICLPEEKLMKANADKESMRLKKSVEQKLECPVYGLIPCFCEVLMSGYRVYALDKPGHPFVAELSALADSIERNLLSP